MLMPLDRRVTTFLFFISRKKQNEERKECTKNEGMEKGQP